MTAHHRTEADPMPVSTQASTKPVPNDDAPARSRAAGAGGASPAAGGSAAQSHAPTPPDVARGLRPLLLDVGVPLGTFYLLRDGFGLSVWLSLALSSVGPAARAVGGIAAERKLNVLALLMLAVNVAGIVVSFLTGDPRAMIAKDSVISSVIAFAILGSVIARRPLMSAGLRPFMTQGTPERSAVWDRLAADSARVPGVRVLVREAWGVVA